MIRPQRANPARRLTRSPEPRRAWFPAATIYEFPFPEGTAFAWRCNHCASGTGQAPTHQQADNDAHIHWRANHNHQETQA